MNRRYTKSHEWIELDGSHGTVGITQYAQKELGEIVYAQLPTVGQSIHAGGEICVLESTKAAADVYCPVSGKITAVNESVASHPQLINQSPEAKAWLFRIELSNPKEASALLSKADYESLIK
jgi:glycine cleavage system H protein